MPCLVPAEAVRGLWHGGRGMGGWRELMSHSATPSVLATLRTRTFPLVSSFTVSHISHQPRLAIHNAFEIPVLTQCVPGLPSSAPSLPVASLPFRRFLADGRGSREPYSSGVSRPVMDGSARRNQSTRQSRSTSPGRQNSRRNCLMGRKGSWRPRQAR